MEYRLWERDEYIIVLNQYLKMPFGRMHSRNAEVIELAKVIDRTPSAVAYRLVNFAHVDPFHIDRGVKGLSGGKKQCEPIFQEYINNKDELFFESERILAKYQNLTIEEKFKDILKDLDLTSKKGEDKVREVKTRINQNFFRQIVLNNYSKTCAISGINQHELLRASHIIPWAKNEKERLNPENGLCLSSLYDSAFDNFLISIDEDFKIIISPLLKKKANEPFYETFFGKYENKKIKEPNKYEPNKDFLKWHLDKLKY